MEDNTYFSALKLGVDVSIFHCEQQRRPVLAALGREMVLLEKEMEQDNVVEQQRSAGTVNLSLGIFIFVTSLGKFPIHTGGKKQEKDIGTHHSKKIF